MTPESGHHLSDLAASRTEPPIVMVPGIDGTALLFYRQQPLLARHFDVIAFPLPTMDPHIMTMASLVDDLATLIEEVSSIGAILVGESFGGALSMSVALARPDLVHGLVIINSFPYFDQRIRLAAAPRLMRIVPWGAMPLVRRYTSAHLHSPHTNAEDIQEFLERAKSIDRNSYIRRLEIIRDYDIREQLHDIGSPTLFLAGTKDRLVRSVDWANYMAERVPEAEMQALEGYGHVCLIDHDLDISERICPWWSTVASS